MTQIIKSLTPGGLGGIGFGPRGELVVPRGIDQEAIGFFDAGTRYGGRPNGSADTFQAVTDAIEDCSDNGGGVVYLRPGEWLIDSKIPNTSRCLDLFDNVHLVGAGRGSTTLILGDNVEGAVVSMIARTNVGVRGLTIDGNRANQTTGVHTVSCADCTRYQIEDLDIFRAKSYGVGLQAGTQSNGLISTIYFAEIGHDCIDFKNPNALNFGNFIKNIWATSFDLGGGNDGAVVDCRGPAIVDGVFYKGTIPVNCSVVRQRQDSGPIDGGHFSIFNNIHVHHDDPVDLHQGNAVLIAGDQAIVSNVVARGTFVALSANSTSTKMVASNIQAYDVTRAFNLDGVDHTLIGATGNACATTFRILGDRNKIVRGRSFGATTRGFDVVAGADATEFDGCDSNSDADAYNDAGTNTVKTNSATLV